MPHLPTNGSLLKTYYIKWGFESRLKRDFFLRGLVHDYIKWGFESRLKPRRFFLRKKINYIKWGFESRLKQHYSRHH